MTDISAKQVKALREKTGAGFMDCKAALQETGGDIEKAVDWLRKKGIAKAAKRAGRSTSEGRVASYIHAGDMVGVLLEIDCESDFVARTDEFRNLCHDLALHVAAAEPRFIGRDEVTQDILDRERAIFEAQVAEAGKPAKVAEKIIAGKMDKFYEEACLLEQHFIKDDKVTVKELVDGAIGKLGENIQVRRFVRFKLGEPTLAAEISGPEAGEPEAGE